MTTIEKQEVWRDRKRYLWLMGLIVPTALFVMLPVVWGLNQLGWHAVASVPFWIGPILLFIVLPALDYKFKNDGQNPPDEVMERLENDKYYRYCTYAYIPFQYASVITAANLFTATDLFWLGFEGGLPRAPLGPAPKSVVETLRRLLTDLGAPLAVPAVEPDPATT